MRGDRREFNVVRRSLAFAGAMVFLVGVGPSLAQEFRWRTYAAGLGSMSGTNGVAVADYDRDGDLDVYFVARSSYDAADSRTWSRLFANRGDGTFSIVAAAAVAAGRDSSVVESSVGYKMGASWGDYDNDGWPDLFLTHLGPNQLLRNAGDGTFEDVTLQAGVAGGKAQLSSSGLWFDYDLDGYLDLYVSTWEDYSEGARDRGNRLYRNTGDGRFEDVSEEAGVADPGATWTTLAVDVNADGLPDLYLANDFGPNKLYLNTGEGDFDEAAAEFNLEDGHHGMGLALADVDRNGLFDFYLTNISNPDFPQERNALFVGLEVGGFRDRAVEAGISQAGWGWGTAFFDLENDGDDDLFVATGNFQADHPNVLFRNITEPGSPLWFEEVAESYGVADLAPGRGVVVFDYDGDGDEDLLISNLFEEPALYENRTSSGSWLQVKLEGTVSSRDALGAIVEVSAGGEEFLRYHHGAQFLGQSLLPVHVGLGDAHGSAAVRVRWPSGAVDDIEAVRLNQTILAKEGYGLVAGETPTAAERTVSRPSERRSRSYPEPFEMSVSVPVELDAPARITMTIFNLLGKSVDVVNGSFAAGGLHVLDWTPPSRLAPGLYFYEIRTSSADAAALQQGVMTYVRP